MPIRKIIILTCLLLSIHPKASGQIRYVQSANNVSSTNSSAIVASFVSNTTVGNAIVVAASTSGPAISSVVDSQGNTYAQAVASGGNAVWYTTAINGGADTITANLAASSGFSLIYIHEYAGLASNPLDQVSSQMGTGTAITSGGVTTTQANELIIGYAVVDYRVSAGGPGFTARQTAGGNMSEDMIVSATGTYAATFTQSFSGGWTSVIATFKAASSTATGYVQSANSVSSTSSTGIAASFANSTTVGNAIVVAASTSGPAISSVVDSQGNTYAQAVASGGNAVWYTTAINGGADTITANLAASSGFSLIYIHEYAGLASNPLDQVSSQMGTGTAITSGGVTTTQANELIIGYAVVDYRVSAGGPGFTARQTAGGNMSEDMTVFSLGTYSATFTQNFSGAWTGMVATFKGAGVGSPTLQSIAVTPTNPTIGLGGNPTQLTATGTYSDSSKQNITSSCSWTTSASGVATVNSAGQVTGGAQGSANITCTIGSVSGFTTVTVGAASLTIRLVQEGSNLLSTSAIGIAGSFAGSTAMGNAIVVAASTTGPTISSVVDSQGNTYAQAVASGGSAVWYTTDIKGGADTITANFAASTAFSLIYIHEYAGLATNPLDQVSSQTGIGTAVNSGAKTTLQANELIFGYASVDHCVIAGAPGFNVRETTGCNMSEDLIVSNTGTYAATSTQDISSGWTGILATFKGASPGGGGTSSISVSVSPKRAALAVGQTLASLSATVTNDNSNQGVTWSISPGDGTISPITSASGANVTLTTPLSAGVYTVTATSVADVTSSASITVAVTDLAGVYTYHNNLARNGANTQEYALTPTILASSAFGKLFSCITDGVIYAQPLWVARLTVNGAKHNVVFVATQHDSVYAFDADANPCVTLWHANLLDANHGGTSGETSVPDSLVQNVGVGGSDISPEIGVTGTPVIDPSTNTLYVVSKSSTSDGTVFQRLHAIDITTGNEKFGGPTNITSDITYPGVGDGGTTVSFSTHYQNQRAGLALVNGTVYVAWASHGDIPPYYGWVVAFNATSLAVTHVLNVSPNVQYGGIWMGGGAPAADNNNNLYLITGNATFDVTNPSDDYGDSALQLSPSLNIKTYFTPSDQSMDNAVDHDFGAGGVTVIVNDASASPNHLVVGGGKDGALYLLNGDSMGGLGDTNARQFFNIGKDIFSTGAFWNNVFYIAGTGPLVSYSFDSSSKMFNPTTATHQSATSYGFPGASPSISATGASSNGIVWALANSSYCTSESKSCGPTVLHAYDATNVANELWNSSVASGDAAGYAVKFTVPTIANGKVYVPTRGNNIGAADSSTSIPGELDVYGLKPN